MTLLDPALTTTLTSLTTAARAARADGADALPPASGRAPEHGGALRSEGQPAPGAAPRAGRGGVELRRRQPGRGTGLPRCRRSRPTTSSTPTRSSSAPTSSRPPSSACACSSSTRRRRPARSRRPRRGHVGAVSHRRRPAAARTGRCRASTAARRPRPSSVLRLAADLGPRPRRCVLPRRLPAARPVRLGRADRGLVAGLRRAAAGRSAPWLLDLGGGFPAAHEGGAPALDAYGAAIRRSLRKRFGSRRPRTIIEPGRSIVADCGAPRDVRRGRGAPRRHPVGLPRRRGLHRTRRDPRRGDPLPTGDRRRGTDRSVRARRADVRQRRRAVREAARAPAA